MEDDASVYYNHACHKIKGLMGWKVFPECHQATPFTASLGSKGIHLSLYCLKYV